MLHFCCFIYVTVWLLNDNAAFLGCILSHQPVMFQKRQKSTSHSLRPRLRCQLPRPNVTEWIGNFCLSNAAMQCIGQTYTITLGMVSDGDGDGDGDVRWRCPMAMSDVRQCVGIGKFTKFSNDCISKSCSPIEMKF